MKRTALPPRRSPLRRVSSKRAAQLRIYAVKRKVFLGLHPLCQWWLSRHGVNEAQARETWYDSRRHFIYFQDTNGHTCAIRAGDIPEASEIHHKKKPRSTYLNDESTWMAVSREGHDWIENHKSEARAKGWLL